MNNFVTHFFEFSSDFASSILLVVEFLHTVCQPSTMNTVIDVPCIICHADKMNDVNESFYMRFLGFCDVTVCFYTRFSFSSCPHFDALAISAEGTPIIVCMVEECDLHHFLPKRNTSVLSVECHVFLLISFKILRISNN